MIAKRIDISKALEAYDKVLDAAKREGRELNTSQSLYKHNIGQGLYSTADRMLAMRAAIEAYEDERKHVITPTRGTGSQLDAGTEVPSGDAFLKHWDATSHGYGAMETFDTVFKAAEAAWNAASRFRAQGGITSDKSSGAEQLVPRTDDFGTVWMVTLEKAAEIDAATREQVNG